MIAGIGVDTTTITRIEKSIARVGFCAHVYGERERAFLESLTPARRAQSAAAAWAAKESFGKALGTGVSGFALSEVQVLHTKDGAPFFAFSGRAAELVKARQLKAHLSITHEGDLATAFVVLETRQTADPF